MYLLTSLATSASRMAAPGSSGTCAIAGAVTGGGTQRGPPALICCAYSVACKAEGKGWRSGGTRVLTKTDPRALRSAPRSCSTCRSARAPAARSTATNTLNIILLSSPSPRATAGRPRRPTALSRSHTSQPPPSPPPRRWTRCCSCYYSCCLSALSWGERSQLLVSSIRASAEMGAPSPAPRRGLVVKVGAPPAPLSVCLPLSAPLHRGLAGFRRCPSGALVQVALILIVAAVALSSGACLRPRAAALPWASIARCCSAVVLGHARLPFIGAPQQWPLIAKLAAFVFVLSCAVRRLWPRIARVATVFAVVVCLSVATRRLRWPPPVPAEHAEAAAERPRRGGDRRRQHPRRMHRKRRKRHAAAYQAVRAIPCDFYGTTTDTDVFTAAAGPRARHKAGPRDFRRRLRELRAARRATRREARLAPRLAAQETQPPPPRSWWSAGVALGGRLRASCRSRAAAVLNRFRLSPSAVSSIRTGECRCRAPACTCGLRPWAPSALVGVRVSHHRPPPLDCRHPGGGGGVGGGAAGGRVARVLPARPLCWWRARLLRVPARRRAAVAPPRAWLHPGPHVPPVAPASPPAHVHNVLGAPARRQIAVAPRRAA